MQSFFLFVLLLATGISNALTIARDDGLSNTTWGGILEDGATMATHSGKNLRDIDDQIRRDRPQSPPSSHPIDDTPSFDTALVCDADLFNATDDSPIQERDDKNTICNIGGYDLANVDGILEGIEYLYEHDEWFVADPGPRRCTRMTCYSNSGIFLCNDDERALKAKCPLIGQYAWEILNSSCTHNNEVNGQRFGDYDNSFNVVVGGDKC